VSVTSILRRGKQICTDKAQIHRRTTRDRFACVRLEHSSYRLCGRITVVCRVHGQNLDEDVFAIRHGTKTVCESAASIYGDRLLVDKAYGRDIALDVPMDILSPGGLTAEGILRVDGEEREVERGCDGKGRGNSVEACRQGRDDVCVEIQCYQVDATVEQNLVDAMRGATTINRAGADERELLLRALSDEIVHS
jgi:hypothetical protein